MTLTLDRPAFASAGIYIYPDDAMTPALQDARSPEQARQILAAHRKGPSADAIAWAFVEAAKAFPGEELPFAGFADRVLQGRVASRSRWIAAAALREVYGAQAMDFLLRGWSDRPIGVVLAGQQRQGWWHPDLQKRLVVGLRFRFGG